MENSASINQDHGHNAHHHVDLQADIASAKLAYEAFMSNDRQKIDFGLAEKDRICKEDPRAWAKAMKEIDGEQEAAREAKAAEQARIAQQAADAAAAAAAAQAQAAPPVPPVGADAAQPVPPPTADAQPISTDVVTAPMTPGYAPQTELAPPPPNTPAYNAAYNQKPEKLYGIDLPFLKLGFTNRGSFEVAPNIGIARVAVKVGLDNRVEGEFMPVGGPLHARVGVGAGINENGIHVEAGAGVNAFNLVNVDGDGGGHLGNGIGVDGDFHGKVLFAEGQGAAGAGIDENGLSVHGGGNAHLGDAIGARGGGRVNLGPADTGASAGVGLTADGKSLDFGPSFDAYPNGDVVPAVHLDAGTTNNATFVPTGDREIDEQR